jgi:predicted DCC family thiol-disulfide oxidoreductase YuxK
MKTTLETESADQKVRLVSRQDRALFTYQEISVHTETAEITQPAEWVFYDGSCRYCTATARWFALALKRRGIGIAPLQSEWVLARLGLDLSEAMEEMRLLDSTGRVYGGADAIIQLARRTWWSVPLFWISFVPGVMPVLRKGYSRIAAWRSCTRFGRCTLPVRTRSATRPSDWLPLLLLPALVGIVGRHWASWVFMWAMALAIFFGSKWLTWKKAIRFVGSTHWRLTLGYFFGWPGLDAGSFLSRGKGGISKRNGSERNQPAALPWLAAGACVCFGSALILDAARKA